MLPKVTKGDFIKWWQAGGGVSESMMTVHD